MIALLQRVSSSKVRVDGEVVGSIGLGLNILLGVVKGDDEEAMGKLLAKIPHLRIFSDESGRMNRSLVDVGGSALVVSQFTLAASLKRGRRPSFEEAMEPVEARRLYEKFCEGLARFVPVEQGVFGATMEVEIHNDGPVTIVLDTREL